MEWTWMKTIFGGYTRSVANFLLRAFTDRKFIDIITSLLQYCKRENSLPLYLKQRRHFAAKLQEAMYTAFAE
jgi:protein MBA1